MVPETSCSEFCEFCRHRAVRHFPHSLARALVIFAAASVAILAMVGASAMLALVSKVRMVISMVPTWEATELDKVAGMVCVWVLGARGGKVSM